MKIAEISADRSFLTLKLPNKTLVEQTKRVVMDEGEFEDREESKLVVLFSENSDANNESQILL